MLRSDNRRMFLKEVGSRMMLMGPSAGSQQTLRGSDLLGWKPHLMKQRDGRGGWILRPAEIQFLTRSSGDYVMIFGVTQMDNREIILVGTWNDGSSRDTASAEKPVVCFSRN